MSLLIGVIDEAISHTDKISWNDNKIGGMPVWMSNSKNIGIPQCNRCAIELTLGVQLYCPLANSAFHRCLYLFICSNPGCPQHNHWRVFRSVLYDESYSTEKEVMTKEFNDDTWTDGQDDWGDPDDWGQGSDEGQSSDEECGRGSRNVPDAVDSFTCDEKCGKGGETLHCDPGETIDNNLCLHESLDKELHSEMRSGAVGSPDHVSTDNDLSSSLSMMAMAGEGLETVDPQDADRDTPIVMEEDVNMSNVHQVFDHLATVLNTKHQTPPVLDPCASRGPMVLKPYYLTVFDDTQPSTHHSKDDRHIANLIKDYERSEGRQLQDLITDRSKAKGKGSSSSESYEKADIKHGDKIFHKFLKVLQKFPEQCVRYDRCGQPLLVQGLSPVESVVPVCTRCGCARVFELQLVPALVPWLRSHQDDSSSIEFGSVLVYTCSRSCPPSNGDLDLVEEHVITQFDPDHHLYR